MSEATVRWVCDSCNEWIEDAGAAEVIFTYDSSRAKDHRIVHKSIGERNCSDAAASSYELESVLGEDGLARLLSDTERSDTASLTEVTRRVHVPYYEAARQHFGESLWQERYAADAYPYVPTTLREFLKESESND